MRIISIIIDSLILVSLVLVLICFQFPEEHFQNRLVDCSNAPHQYREATFWLDEGGRWRCAVTDKEKAKASVNYLFYSDAVVGVHLQ